MSKPENKETAAKPNTAAADCSGASNAGGAAVSIIINKAYITSISGILKIMEFILLLLAFSIAADINIGNWGRMSFFLFVTITSWLFVIAWFVLFTFNLHTKINLSINWNLTLLIFAADVASFLLISSALLANDVRKFRGYSKSYTETSTLDSLQAAVAFGFIAMFVFIGDAVVEFLKIIGKTRVQIAP